MTLAVEVAGKTDVGCVRANNEDNFGWDARYGIFVVCDGMGGQAAGEVASKIAVDQTLGYFRGAASQLQVSPNRNGGARPHSGSAALKEAIVRANRTIYDAAHREDARSGMGTTIVAALIRGNAMAIGHVGDSRIYVIRHGQIEQLTQDHSLVAEQVRLGYITAEQAETSELQNVILRALGSEAEVQADLQDLPAIEGDVLLMTSDGLTRHLRDQEILTIVSQAPSLDRACANLIATAKERGGQDNITCLLLRIVAKPWYKKVFEVFSGGPQWQNSI